MHYLFVHYEFLIVQFLVDNDQLMFHYFAIFDQWHVLIVDL
jgi:hypothetical protein